ncbi:MAG: SET domain-containing protein-lysine N-methyltransferase, partial [Pirellulales bacterium]|nr:SET domain-containing protein-lysine N-methyltransferase [Pirellulales bacterium]
MPKLDKRHIRFRVEYRESKIHRWGLFALEAIPAGRRVIEYTGERIDEREAERRSVRPAV